MLWRYLQGEKYYRRLGVEYSNKVVNGHDMGEASAEDEEMRVRMDNRGVKTRVGTAQFGMVGESNASTLDNQHWQIWKTAAR